MRSAKSFCTFSADNWEPFTGGDCSGSGESRGWVLAVRWSSSSAWSRRRCMSDACGRETRSGLEDRERWRCGNILQVLCPWGEGDLEDDRVGQRWGTLVRDGGDDWRPRDDRRDRRWREGERRRGDRDGRPASLLVMLAPEGQREGASDELVSRETSRLSHRERLAGGDRRLVGGEESGDTWGRLTPARFLSVEDLSLDLLWWRTLLPARYDPALPWARDASRSSLSCRSESKPMFAEGTAGPTVCWGGASPTNCCQ